MSTSEERLTVIAPVDYSACSGRALAWAIDYAQRAPCEIHLLHVLDRHVHLGDFSTSARTINQELEEITVAARRELETMATDAEARKNVGRITRHVAVGGANHEIVGLANRLGADLIVMGTHGRTGIRRAVIGSVAEYVVRHAPCTVVCVKPTVEAEAGD